MLVNRLAKRDDCGECGRKFQPFEVVHYLGIDNNTFCSSCRWKLDPDKTDDYDNLGGWVPSLYIGTHEEGKDNILQLIKLWNDSLDKYDYNLRIELSE